MRATGASIHVRDRVGNRIAVTLLEVARCAYFTVHCDSVREIIGSAFERGPRRKFLNPSTSTAPSDIAQVFLYPAVFRVEAHILPRGLLLGQIGEEMTDQRLFRFEAAHILLRMFDHHL